jgi:hypothetical protein
MKIASALSLALACGVLLGAGASYGDGAGHMLAAAHDAVREANPPGDIPDNQVFVVYRSPLGFSIKAPEGWARHETAATVSFADRYNIVAIAIVPRAAAPTSDDLASHEVADMRRDGKMSNVSAVKAVRLPSGDAFVVTYQSSSESSPVTNKAIRLDNERYFFWKGGRLATLTLCAPVGADNADQWKLIAGSFAWR